jgi:hypothetical protein
VSEDTVKIPSKRYLMFVLSYAQAATGQVDQTGGMGKPAFVHRTFGLQE